MQVTSMAMFLHRKTNLHNTALRHASASFIMAQYIMSMRTQNLRGDHSIPTFPTKWSICKEFPREILINTQQNLHLAKPQNNTIVFWSYFSNAYNLHTCKTSKLFKNAKWTKIKNATFVHSLQLFVCCFINANKNARMTSDNATSHTNFYCLGRKWP